MGLKVKSPATVYLGSAVDPGSGGGGGSSQTGEYYVRVFDYDGSLLDEKWLNDGDEYTLPEHPTHDNMIFDDWSSTEYVTNNKIVVDKNNVLIGAGYTTLSGYSEFDIELNKATGLTVEFDGDGEKDWGDGTIDSLKIHTYNNYGEYTIIFKGNNLSAPAFKQSTAPYDNIFCKAIRLMNITLSAHNIFYHLVNLKTITMKGVTTSSSFISYCPALKAVIFNKNFSFSSNAFPIGGDNTSLETVIVPKGLTKLPQLGSYMTCLRNFVIPNGITEIIHFGYQWGLDYFVVPYTMRNIKGPFITNAGNLKGFICNSDNILHEDFNGNDFLTASSNYILKDMTKALPNNFSSPGNVFHGMHNITSLILPSGVNKIKSLCNYCADLKELILNEGLTEIGGIDSCYNLEYLKFPSTITKIYSNSFRYNYSIKEYDFSDLLSVPILEGSDCFNNSSSYSVNFKILVPWDLYLDWKAATNWSALEKLIDTGEAATVNFISNTNFNTYVDNILMDSNSVSWKGNTISYTCHDITNNIILQDQYTNISEGEIVNISVNFSNYNRVTLSTGVSGLTVKFYLDGMEFIATDDNGDYYINIIGSNKNLSYRVCGANNYLDEIGTIVTTGSDITESITLTSATTQTFNRPNLTENGTLGENNFAVSANYYGSSYVAYKAVDDSNNTYWTSSYYGDRTYTFYNPNQLKVDTINILYTSSSASSNKVNIQGSMDNINWVNINSSYSRNNTNGTLLLNNDDYYKYYKLIFEPYNSSSTISVYNINIVATEKLENI